MPAISAPRGRAAKGTSSRARAAPVRRGSAPTVRWDRVGRLAMLCVLGALLYLYLSAGVHMFSTWRQSRHDKATVAAMAREHVQLVRAHEILSSQSTLEAEARQLGMMKKGEQPYVLSGLPSN